MSFVCYAFLFQAVPGPGKYEIKGTFDQSPPKVNTEGIEVEHPPFLAQAKVIKMKRSMEIYFIKHVSIFW